MHFTGTIWRPPYEAGSLLLEATVGCTHHRCKFCNLYDNLPTPFRMAPLEQIEADLLEVQMDLRRRRSKPQVRRVFLVGGNPFALESKRLRKIGERIRQYFPECQSVGCFARVTDISRKSDRELEELRRLGYNGISIGVETGDDGALLFMNKGYQAEDILRQCGRLDAAGMGYHFFYLAGLSGAGQGAKAARLSAQVFNQTKPGIIGSSMLTVFPGTALFQEAEAGTWREAGEVEKLEELAYLIRELTIPVYFATLGESNGVFVEGQLPGERERILGELQEAIDGGGEVERGLQAYRKRFSGAV